MKFGETIQSKNFLDTFGFLEFDLPKDLKYDDFIRDVNNLASKQLSLPWEAIAREKRSLGVISFADNSPVASDFLVNWLDKRIQYLLGSNYYYLGSDASIFFAAGSAWHRDLAMRLPLLKFLIYLDYDKHDYCCDFMIIPGSHHVYSNYASLLQKGLAWPDKEGYAGGITENSFFPSPSDPTDPCYSGSLDAIPSVTIPVVRGKAVLFNEAAIHAVKSSVPIGKPRRLATYVFCANPIDLSPTHYCREPLGKNYSNDELINEVFMFYAMLEKRLGIVGYGNALMEHRDYVNLHGLDWKKIHWLAETLGDDYKKEDGSHEQAQMKQMSAFLLQNIKDIDAELIVDK